MTPDSADIFFMQKALVLAEKGRGLVSPNPVVGACVVRKGRVVGSGYHRFFGGPHAEIMALEQAGRKSKGAVLYLTLEPCSTFGKTPPCTDAIIRAGIRRVVIGVLDANPSHHGRARSFLKRAGVQVETGVLAESAKEQNAAFFKWIQKKTPYVILKMAQSLDGKIATRTGASRWISGPAAREWTHRLRASVDAVAVGKNTALLDNPRLTVREAGRKKNIWRIVLDASGSLPKTARLFQEKSPVLLACASRVLSQASKRYRHLNVTILPIFEIHGKLDLDDLLSKLGALGITSLLVEGGGEVAWSFLSRHLVDRLYWIVSPKIIGGASAKTSVEGSGFSDPNRALPVSRGKWQTLGNDLLFEGYLN